MGKVKWILLVGALLALCSGQMMAGPGSDTRVFFDSHTTTNASAVLMGFAAQLGGGGARTSLAVSNTTGAPGLEGLPEGGDSSGQVWLFCYNTLTVTVEPAAVAASMHEITPIVVQTSALDAPDTVGTGLDEDGMLDAGGTWLVFLDEALGAAGFDGDFVGYCYVIGEFDAITGFNISSVEGVGAVGLAMTSDFTGAPVVVPMPDPAQ